MKSRFINLLMAEVNNFGEDSARALLYMAGIDPDDLPEDADICEGFIDLLVNHEDGYDPRTKAWRKDGNPDVEAAIAKFPELRDMQRQFTVNALSGARSLVHATTKQDIPARLKAFYEASQQIADDPDLSKSRFLTLLIAEANLMGTGQLVAFLRMCGIDPYSLPEDESICRLMLDVLIGKPDSFKVKTGSWFNRDDADVVAALTIFPDLEPDWRRFTVNAMAGARALVKHFKGRGSVIGAPMSALLKRSQQ